MSQTSWQKQQQPLDALQSMINGVLIETGKALRSANKKGVATIGRADNRLQLLLPNTLEKFHLALDELESDIVRAKAVLSRDLRVIRAKRNQLEHPIEQEVQDATNNSEGERLLQASPKPKEVSSPKIVSETQDFIKAEDNVTDNASVKMAPSPKSKVESPSSSLPPPQSMQIEVQSQETSTLEADATDNQGKVDPLLATSDLSNPEMPPEIGTISSDPIATVASEAAETLDLQSTSFDSIFDTNESGDANLNFDDFDFSGDNTGNQNLDFGNNGEGFDLSSFGNQDNTENGGTNSLPQDLDGFGDGSASDFAMLDASNAAGIQEVGENSGGEFQLGSGDMDVNFDVVNESTFDELLHGMDFGDGLDGTADDVMEHGQFADAYFGMNNDS